MMKRTKTALAAALLAGTAGLVAAQPAVAKKDQAQAQQGPQLKLSADFRKVAAPAQQALNSGDLATAATGITAAEAAAKTDDEKYIAAQLRLSLVAKQQQAAGQNNAAGDAVLTAPLDALIANPVTPKDQLGKYAYLRGTIAFEQKKYKDALGYYQKAQAAGYQNTDMPLQIAKAKVESGDVPGGVAEIDAVIKQDEASGQKAPEDLYRYAVAKMYTTTDRAGTLSWVQRWLQAYPSAKNWRTAIFVFGFQGPTAAQLGKAQKIDLYRLMSVTNSLADEGDYLQYAQYCLDLGLPDEAKTVLTKGKASGKVPTSGTYTSLNGLAQKQISSEGSLASLATKAKASSSGDLASQTADAYLGQDKYAEAIELYKVGLQKGVKDSNLVNLHLGIAEALSGDKASAAAQFDKVQPGPDKDVATLWKTWATTGTGPATTAAGAATPAAAPAG